MYPWSIARFAKECSKFTEMITVWLDRMLRIRPDDAQLSLINEAREKAVSLFITLKQIEGGE